jgi:hypothetical protein
MQISLGGHTRSAGSTRRALFGSAVASALAGATLLAGATTVAADETWCDVDPPVLIRTPGGNNVVVFVADGGADAYRDWLKRPQITYTVTRAPGRRTQVDLGVVIPAADGVAFPMRSRVWSSPGQGGVLLSERIGVAGETLGHSFQLDVE